MTSREQFLQRFTDIAVKDTALPSFEFAAIDAPLKTVFSELLVKVGGQLGTGNNISQLQQFAEQKMAEGYQVLSLVEGITGNRDPKQITDPHQLADIDYTIAPATIAVAENGSVWLDSEKLVTRNSVFICQHLIAVCPVNNIVGTLNEGMRKVDKISANWGCFISGPSKTADIEQALVIGAHGAMSMTVWLMD
jgi:L-lactate dehydrogenase complex protein LldG